MKYWLFIANDNNHHHGVIMLNTPINHQYKGRTQSYPTLATHSALLLLVSLMIGCGGDSGSTTTASENDEDITLPDDNSTSDDSSTPGDSATDDGSEQTSLPNILFILSDDQGLDASAQYSLSSDVPITPTLNQLAAEGVTFDNAWATPACTTTRGTILTGKYGVNSGVTYVPAKLETEQVILQEYLQNDAASEAYQSAVFGKWHVAGGKSDANHPNDAGVDYYAGNLGNLDDYNNWSLTINGETETSTTYHSTHITDLALTWINTQSSPWFVWLAYSAPHDPFHLPPTDLHSRDLSGTEDDINNNSRSYYLAAIEAMDSEIGRLLATLPDETRDNTIIIFMGDNGTPKGVVDTNVYKKTHSKSTLYQGGVAVPLVVSGKGVTRSNERESGLVTATDLYATIGEIAGIESTSVNDSTSFKSLLTDANSTLQSSVYTEFESDTETGWTVRNSEYKYISYEDGTEALYDISEGFTETENLLPSIDDSITEQVIQLKAIGEEITGA